MDDFEPTDWPEFIELPGFTRAWAALGLHDGDLRALQAAILSGPDRHLVVSGTGGLRRRRSRGRAKGGARAGAYRVCYAALLRDGVVVLAMVYGKDERADLTATQRKEIAAALRIIGEQLSRGGSPMKHGESTGSAKAGRSKGDEIVEGLRELIDVLRSGEPLESRFTVRTYKAEPALARTRIPYLRHTVQIDQSLGQQHRHASAERAVEPLAMGGAGSRQGVVFDPDIAEDPAIVIVLVTGSVEFPGATDTVDRRIEPQRHQDLGIDGGMPRVALDGLDGAVQGAEIQSLAIVPDESRGMIVGDQFVERDGPEGDLVAVGGPQSRASGRGRWLGGSGRPLIVSRCLEERGPLGPGRRGSRGVLTIIV